MFWLNYNVRRNNDGRSNIIGIRLKILDQFVSKYCLQQSFLLFCSLIFSTDTLLYLPFAF